MGLPAADLATGDFCLEAGLRATCSSAVVPRSGRAARGSGGTGIAKQSSVSAQMLQPRRLLATSALLSLLTLVGCASTAYVGAEVPVGVETYPITYYDGHVVYWSGDRWYTYRDGAWVYYNAEPVYLYRYRSRWRDPYYRHAPRYYYQPRYYHYRPRQAAPPVRRAAPPARRR